MLTTNLYEAGITLLGACILRPYIGSYRAIRTSEGASRHTTSIWSGTRFWATLEDIGHPSSANQPGSRFGGCYFRRFQIPFGYWTLF